MIELFDASPRIWLACIYIGAAVGFYFGWRNHRWYGALLLTYIAAFVSAALLFILRGLYFVTTGN